MNFYLLVSLAAAAPVMLSSAAFPSRSFAVNPVVLNRATRRVPVSASVSIFANNKVTAKTEKSLDTMEQTLIQLDIKKKIAEAQEMAQKIQESFDKPVKKAASAAPKVE